ncbi:hypothetical protein J7I81_12105 [Bacillus sp. ISL-32]|nr:hypothetical protein [Bacillus sp. ISL-32]
MVNLIEDKDKFFAKYNIQEEKFEKTGLKWNDLKEIYDDYLKGIHLLRIAGENIAEILRILPDAHSVRMRIKDPEHLIEKLIRKKIKDDKFSFDVKDYKEKITDLIGIRVLHLFKEDANFIDESIRENWNLVETATIYYRKGDLKDEETSNGSNSKSQNTSNEENLDFVLKEHPAGYRSWHYLIETNLTKEKFIAEIQVRTIFEEGWSEIDHRLRYPYNTDDNTLTNQLLVLNRLAGSADEMVDSIKETLDKFNQLKTKEKEAEQQINELRETIEQTNLEKPQKDTILGGLAKINDDLRASLTIPQKIKNLDSNWLENVQIVDGFGKVIKDNLDSATRTKLRLSPVYADNKPQKIHFYLKDDEEN